MLWARAHYLLYTYIWHKIHLAVDFSGFGYDDFLRHQAKCWKERTLQDAEPCLLIKGLRGLEGSASGHRGQHTSEPSLPLCALRAAGSPILCSWPLDLQRYWTLLPYWTSPVFQQKRCFCSQMYHSISLSLPLTLSFSVRCTGCGYVVISLDKVMPKGCRGQWVTWVIF